MTELAKAITLLSVFVAVICNSPKVYSQAEFFIRFSDDCSSFEKVNPDVPVAGINSVAVSLRALDEENGIYYFLGSEPHGIHGVNVATGELSYTYEDPDLALTTFEYVDDRLVGMELQRQTNTKQMFVLDLNTGIKQNLGSPLENTSLFQFFHALSESDSLFTIRDDDILYTFNYVTGELLYSPALQLPIGGFIDQISFSEDGNLYALIGENQNSAVSLATINVTDGSITKVGGPHANIIIGGGLATIDDTNGYYIHQVGGSLNAAIIKFDLGTGEIISNQGIPNLVLGENVLNIEYDHLTQTLYGLHNDVDFDPTSLITEICDNGIDDDGDGAVDCEDSELANNCCCLTPVVVSLQDYSVCEGSVIVLEADTDFTGIFSWSRDGQVLSEMGAQLEVTAPGTYVVSIMDQCGNVSQATSVVTINPSTPVSLPATHEFCSGTTGILQAATIASSIAWYFNGVLIPNQNGTTLAVTQSGEYMVVVATGSVCETRAVTQVSFVSGMRSFETHYLCEGSSVEVEGLIYTIPGLYSLTLPNGSDCDRILDFEIIELPSVRLEDDFVVCEGEVVMVDGVAYLEPGDFTLTFPEPLGGCDTIYNFSITHLPVPQEQKFLQILDGNPVSLNGVTYDTPGQFTQRIPAASGCDSICIVNVAEESCLLYYNFDVCNSSVTLGAHDYSEFEPNYPDELDCATIVASDFFRVNPTVNKHSCTEGLDGTSAICISSEEGCAFVPSSPMAGRIAVAVRPEINAEVFLSRLTFAQMAPEFYEWSHSTGLNNYPTKFGVRIVADGEQVFLMTELNTSTEWSNMEFQLEDRLSINSETNLEIQILGYCLIGNNSSVSAFDIENIKLFGGCRPTGASRLLAGTVKLRNQREMTEVNISAIGNDQISEAITATNGSFAFGNSSEYADYQFSAKKDKNHLEGVSTIDLIRIQRHILGLELLDNPLDLVAADINNNGQIDGLDLVELRKLILGIYTEFPANYSYRFFEKKSALSAHTITELYENIRVAQSSEHRTDLDFIGIKIGDVNSTITTVSRRSALTLDLVTVDQYLVKGENVTIPIYAKSNTHLMGLQTTFGFDPAALEFDRVEQGAINITDSHIGILNLSEGEMTLSWNKALAQSIAEDEVLFELEFIVKKSGKLSDNLFVKEAAINSEAYVSATETVALELSFEKLEAASFELHQNSPNPFTDKTEIRFSLPESSFVTLTVYDVSGREILRKRNKYESGTNSILLNSDELTDSGVLYYKLDTDYGAASQKMIHLR